MNGIRRGAARGARPAAKLSLVLALLAAGARPARAQTADTLPPWHAGVSEAQKQKAQALFAEARTLHRSMMLAEARAKYEEALAAWEHPELRFYLGKALKSIGLPLLAYDSLRLALRWGPGALDPDEEQDAHATMRALLEQELAVISIRCDEPGAVVLLDGKPWFNSPGAERRMVTPGEHVITARKKGYYTVVKPVLVLAGKEASGELALSVDTVVTERRWPPWIPWATAGAGAALTALGAGLFRDADARHDQVDQQLHARCAPSCRPTGSDAYASSVVENRLAIGALIAGGATLLAGAALLILNRPQPYRTEDRGGVELKLLPAVSGKGASLSARLTF